MLREIGPTDPFGEIGLLTGSPRTATVTAVTSGQLFALEKADFLALVGQGPDLSEQPAQPVSRLVLACVGRWLERWPMRAQRYVGATADRYPADADPAAPPSWHRLARHRCRERRSALG